MRQLLYEITHITAYDYAGQVSVSHHQLRLSPRRTAQQRCVEEELQIEPTPTVISKHSDYFGNTSHFITVDRPHGRLVVTARSRVALSPAAIPEPTETPSWEAVRTRCRGDRSGAALEAHEFTYASPLIPRGPEYSDYAAASFAKDRPILDAVSDLNRRISVDFAFDPTATTVTTPVAEFFQRRRGVCQDFAQFQIACLRSLGLSARYVSGYLETDPPPGQTKLRGSDASHAWVGFYCHGLGWIQVDPTNNCLPSLRHIMIGWGRDYSDVAPVRGVLLGGQRQQLRVSVDVVALGPLDEEADESQDQKSVSEV